MDIELILVIVSLGFLASFIDAVVGGGGLISIPTLLATGMNPATVLGTNKLSSALGALTSTISFIRSGKVDFHIVGKLFPFSVIASLFGALTATKIPPELLKPIVIILLIGKMPSITLRSTLCNRRLYIIMN